MRLIAIILAGFFIIPAVSAQSFNNPRSVFVEAYDINGIPLTLKKPEVEGTPMVNSTWGTGYILFKNGRRLANVELNFNLLENALYFRKDDTEFAFADQVKEGQFAVNEDGINKTFLFRSGYPETDKTNGNFFYQVVAEGQKFHLLKYALKKIEQQWRYNEAEKKFYKLTEGLYVYIVAEKNLIKIRKDKTSLIDAFPVYADTIKQFIQQKKYKLRSETEIAELINFLNQ